MNNLGDVYRLHCGAELSYDKSLSKVFVTGTLDDVRASFDALMTYCANDVRATHELAQILVPEFREASPHPVTFSGLLEMSSVYLPVNKNWETYIRKANTTCDEIETELRQSLVKLAVEAVTKREKDAYKDDLWLWDLDWSTQKATARYGILCPIHYLIGWLVDWSIHCPIVRLIGWLIGRLIDWLVCWSIDWLIDFVTLLEVFKHSESESRSFF